MSHKKQESAKTAKELGKMIEEARRSSSGSWSLAESYRRYLQMRRDYEKRFQGRRGAAAPAQRYQANP